MSLCLCFSGGVAFPYTMIGCIQVLLEKGVVDNAKSYSSSGNGCFFSLCLCLGIDINEIIALIPKFSEIKDSYLNTLSTVSSSENYDLTREFFGSLLIETLRIIPTFKQLYLLTDKTLHISSYKKYEDDKVIYFDRFTSPNMSVLDAICLGCCYDSKDFTMKFSGELYSDPYYKNPLPITCFKKKDVILCFSISYSILPSRNDVNDDVLETLQTSVDSLMKLSLSKRKNSKLMTIVSRASDYEESNIMQGYKSTKFFLSHIEDKKVFLFK